VELRALLVQVCAGEPARVWKGTIGHANHHLRPERIGRLFPELSPDHYTHSGSVVHLGESAISRPSGANDVVVKWAPAFTNISLNGRDLFDEYDDLTTDDLIHFFALSEIERSWYPLNLQRNG